MNHPGITIWLTGLSGSGKTTLAKRVEAELRSRQCRVELLDGDVVRTHLSKGLGFSRADRDTNVCRIGFVAGLLCRHGVITLVAAISPYRNARDQARQMSDHFIEVYVNAPLATCEARDVKGLYAKARAGEIAHFTGIDDPYEPPETPEIVCYTDQESIDTSVAKIIAALEQLGYVEASSVTVAGQSAD